MFKAKLAFIFYLYLNERYVVYLFFDFTLTNFWNKTLLKLEQ